MNANELADKLEDALDTDSWCQECALETTEPVARQTATMLRQQQAEIEALRMGFAGNGTSDSELAEVRAMANRWFLEIQALKQIIDANNLSQNIGQFVKPANEPVAWMFQGAFDISTYVSFEKPNPDIYPNPTPLYTHPAKTLTDEEILLVSDEFKGIPVTSVDAWNKVILLFGKAILRKAQEK
jgi:hypothetical protein